MVTPIVQLFRTPAFTGHVWAKIPLGVFLFKIKENKLDANIIISRIAQLKEAVDQSAANHNGLVGRLLEAQELLASLAQPIAAVVEECVDAVEDAIDAVAE